MTAENIKILRKQALADIDKAQTIEAVLALSVKYLGRKSELSQFLRGVKDLPPEDKMALGKAANEARSTIEAAIESKRERLQGAEVGRLTSDEKIDISAPGRKLDHGHLHPLTLVQRQVVKIFGSMGFHVIDGPEVENEWYNFDALNVPSDHPAREMQDTFWLKQKDFESKEPIKKLLPRTHTSPVQIRFMEKHQPPFRIIVPGRTFRNEATDATHESQFYQFEGLMVGKDVSLANLKAILEFFFNKFFNKKTEIRLVQSYFPFTEPSVEIMAKIEGRDKISNRWLEIAGAGMVHQNVFKNVGYAPKEYQGFAFGMTIDRLAMLKYGIDDIRLLYSNDLRFLKQF